MAGKTIRQDDDVKTKSTHTQQKFLVGLLGILLFPAITFYLLYPKPLNLTAADAWGPGIDIIILLDVSLSSFPEKDTKFLDPYLSDLVSKEIVKNLKGITQNTYGDRIAIIAFADTFVQVFPQNGFYGYLGGPPASKSHITTIVKSCINRNYPLLKALDKRKTDIAKVLKFVWNKIDTLETNISNAEKQRPRLVLLLTDGVQDKFNQGENAKKALEDKKVIHSNIGDIQRKPETQLWLFHLPDPDSVKNNNLGYTFADEWKDMGIDKYIAPSKKEEMEDTVKNAFTNFRLESANFIQVGEDSPFILIKQNSVYALRGTLSFSIITPQHPGIENLWIKVEADSIAYFSDQNKTSKLKFLVSKLDLKIQPGEKNVKQLHFIYQDSLESPVDEGEFILKFKLIGAGPADKLPAYFKFIQIHENKEELISGKANPHAASAYYKFKRVEHKWSFMLPIFFTLIALIWLGKISSGLRYFKGWCNWGQEIVVTLLHPISRKVAHGPWKYDFIGILPINFKYKNTDNCKFKLMPLGENFIKFIKQRINPPTDQDNSDVKKGKSQTYLLSGDSEKEPDKKAIFFDLSPAGGPYKIGVQPQYADNKNRQEKIYEFGIKYKNTNNFLRRISGLFDFKNENSRCKMEWLIWVPLFWALITIATLKYVDPTFETMPFHAILMIGSAVVCMIRVAKLREEHFKSLPIVKQISSVWSWIKGIS